MGLCHYVGSYCSDKVLGVCTSKRKSYCCFESKLSRILQEQGRRQIGKAWGEAREPTCEGFSIEEFQRLDLSEMDFSEVYDEFVDAVRVPDEVQTSIEIQGRIEDYYRLHQGT
jgi:conjugal transfer mating pair stabilization protein TraN